MQRICISGRNAKSTSLIFIRTRNGRCQSSFKFITVFGVSPSTVCDESCFLLLRSHVPRKVDCTLSVVAGRSAFHTIQKVIEEDFEAKTCIRFEEIKTAPDADEQYILFKESRNPS